MNQNSRLKMQLTGNEIEAQSFRLIADEIDLSHLSRKQREVAARVIHACADPSIADSLTMSPNAIDHAIALLKNGSKVISDVEMVRRALYASDVICALDFSSASAKGKTRTQVGIELAAKENPDGAVFVVGCAPTALFSLLDMARKNEISPGVIIALPVGYVGAAQSKEALANSPYEFVTNEGPRGGSAITAAAFNAIARMAIDNYSYEKAISNALQKS